MVTDKAYWMGRDVKYASELTQTIRANANELLLRVNGLLVDLGRSPIEEGVNSGWRPQSVNAQTPGAAAHSSHMTGEAVDLTDAKGEIDAAIMAHPELLKKHKLNLEHPDSTPGWCHLDTRAGIGYRVFRP
jgi:hypothetical protein